MSRLFIINLSCPSSAPPWQFRSETIQSLVPSYGAAIRFQISILISQQHGDSDEDSYRAVPPGIIRSTARNQHNIYNLVRNLFRQYFLRASGALYSWGAAHPLSSGAAGLLYILMAQPFANITTSTNAGNKRTFCLRRSRICLMLIKTTVPFFRDRLVYQQSRSYMSKLSEYISCHTCSSNFLRCFKAS